MTWKAFIYPSPKLQELYRLALCICGVTILLGAWRDIGYHSGLLAVLPALFIYQFGSYLTTHSTLSTLNRQRLSLAMEFSDGLITGLLIALAAFDPIITLALGGSLFSHHSRRHETHCPARLIRFISRRPARLLAATLFPCRIYAGATIGYLYRLCLLPI
ncbi:hypothetical protein N9Q87_01160 [Porticoccaceae bacterium]|nr:hypothetical protein [Porticoccaceae bacterium]